MIINTFKSLLRKIFPEINILLLIAILNFNTGCYYYKVYTLPPTDQTAMQEIKSDERYIILHQGNMAWHLQSVKINEEKKEITGELSNLSENHQYYKYTDPYINNQYKRSKGYPYFEYHIYTSEYIENSDTKVTIPISSIIKIEIYDKAKGATRSSIAFTVIGSVLGAAAIAAIVLALSSCPYVYTHDGITYHFVGEMYGGAIHPSIERDDYMPLPGFNSVNGVYQLKISNELQERQYTDIAELMVVQHPDNTQVILDKYGNVQTLLNPLVPQLACSEKNNDRMTLIMKKDSSFYSFNDENGPDDQLSSLTLSFRKPPNAQTGKLLLNARNSVWVDYIVENFNRQFGKYYNSYVAKQKNADPQKVKQWSIEQGFLLSVYIETNEGWQFVDYINTIGPKAARDIVLPIDLSKVQGDDVKLRLECGFNFWELDYAAIDFSENVSVDISHLSPVSAINEKGVDVVSLLKSTDKQYYEQPEVGNEAVITYKAPQLKEYYKQTAFLHSRGYYEYIRNYKEKPNFKALKSFKDKLAFTKFSKQKYIEIIKNGKLSVLTN